MPHLTVAPDPCMTRYLAAVGVFRKDPITVIDIGARANSNRQWHHFGADLRYVGFEPHAEECARLNAVTPDTATFYPFALAREPGKATLHVHDNPTSSSLYPPDPEVLKRFAFRDNMRVVESRGLELTTLDLALDDKAVGPVDFIHVDAEGADLDILRGGENTLRAPSLFGLCTEVRLNRFMRTPVFSEVDAFLRGFAFDLYDLDVDRESRAALPYPVARDHRHDVDPTQPILGPSVRGQVFWGDALYFRDLVDPEVAKFCEPLPTAQILKLACAFEIFRLKDCAAELILVYKAQIDELCDHAKLLEILVPGFEPRRGYEDYVAEYFRDRQGFRQR